MKPRSIFFRWPALQSILNRDCLHNLIKYGAKNFRINLIMVRDKLKLYKSCYPEQMPTSKLYVYIPYTSKVRAYMQSINRIFLVVYRIKK